MFNKTLIVFELENTYCNESTVILKAYEIAQETDVVIKKIDFTWYRKKIKIKGNKKNRQSFVNKFLSAIVCKNIKF